MAYRMVYFRIRTEGYASGWSSKAAETMFREESRRLFQELGWSLQTGRNGASDTVTKDRQDLYLHPDSFSGVMEESGIEPLRERLTAARTFRCYAVDRYAEYMDMSDDEYRAELEEKRNEITVFVLEQCRTKRTNLYITDPVALHIAEHFEIPRLCDRDRHNGVGIQFMSELVERLLQQGRLCSAETTHGRGIRTATAKELKKRPQPAEQVDGQLALLPDGGTQDTGTVTPSGRITPRTVRCVRAADVAAVMGQAGWLVSEGRYMETIRWGDDGIDHYIIYEDEERGTQA